MFLDDARAVADWDAQLDPVVPLERRDRQEVDAVRHEPAGVLRELQRRQERRDVLRAGSRRRLQHLHMGAEMAHKGFLKEWLKSGLFQAIFEIPLKCPKIV